MQLEAVLLQQAYSTVREFSLKEFKAKTKVERLK